MDTAWRGQAGLDVTSRGQKNWADLATRKWLAAGDIAVLTLFAWGGRASHGMGDLDFSVLVTAFPFYVGKKKREKKGRGGWKREDGDGARIHTFTRAAGGGGSGPEFFTLRTSGKALHLIFSNMRCRLGIFQILKVVGWDVGMSILCCAHARK